MRILIADDELMARRRLLRLLSALPDVEVVGECADGDAVLTAVASLPVDVVLLDIHMPALTGIEALSFLGEDAPHVIFTTAHADYALEAFDQGAIDYVLKPVTASRLKVALDRVRARTRPAAPALDRLPVETRKGVRLLDPATISHCTIEGASVVIVCESERLITAFRLSDLERRLAHHPFERVHRTVLINLQHLARLESVDSGGYIAHMRNGDALPVSRKNARLMRKRLDLPR